MMRIRMPYVLLSFGLGLLAWACTAPNIDYCQPGSISAFCVDVDDNTQPDLSTDVPPVDMADPRRDMPGRDDMTGKPDGGMTPLDVDSAGPFKTATINIPVRVTAGTTNTTVIGPSDDGTTLTTKGAPFPVVVLSPGFTLATSYFTNYGQRLASYGIITVMQKVQNEIDHAQYRDSTIELIDWLLAPTGPSAMQIRGRIDPDKVGLVGHSLGGKISILVAARDKRIKALFGIDPVDSNTNPAKPEIAKVMLPAGTPVGLIGETVSKGGTPPCAPADSNFETLYAAAPSPAFAVTVSGAAHNDFIDLCGFACMICPGGTAPKDRTNRLGVRYMTAYFLLTLRGDTRAMTYLSGAELGKDIAAGYVTRVAK